MPAVELEILATDETEKQLCRDYWALISPAKFSYSVAKLAELYKISKTRVNEIAARGCHAYLAGDCCRTPNCASLRPIQSRAQFERARRYSCFQRKWTCDKCTEFERARLEKDQARRTARLQDQLKVQVGEAKLVGQLSLRDTVFLVSALRAGGTERLDCVRPLPSFSVPLSPRGSYDEDILLRLFDTGLLCIDPRTPVELAVIGGSKPVQYPLREVSWTLPLPPDGPSPARFLEVLEQSLHDPWSDDWVHEGQALHREVALQECLRFLEVLLEEHHFNSSCGEKTQCVLRSVLRRFSIGQAFYFIRYAVTQAASDVQKRLARPHVLNKIPVRIQIGAERARAQGWNVSHYRRYHRIPESQLTQVLFTSALKLPDGGLSTIPPWETVDAEALARPLAGGCGEPGTATGID